MNYINNYKKHVIRHYIFLFIILLSLFCFTGCNEKSTLPNTSSSSVSENPQNTQKLFDDFTDEIFEEEITTDSITLNYSLAHPENYGITEFTPTLGTYSYENMKKDLAISENYLAKLHSFSRDDLTPDQQLTYDVLEYCLELDNIPEDLLLYNEILGPNTGIQAQLPVLLSEYKFYNEQAVQDYLSLLPCVKKYFTQIVEFELLKSQAGLFMSDTTCNAILKQCEDFIADANDNYLIDTFNTRIMDVEGLSDAQITQYCTQNKTLVITEIIPAYELLINGLSALKGSGVNEKGLSGLPKGQEYYELLMRSTTGSTRSIKEIDSLLDDTIQQSLHKMSSLISEDSSLLDKSDNITYPSADPEKIIAYLKKAIQDNYPALSDVNCSVKYVHESLEESLSPAFYLSPPFDDCSENSVYINGNDRYDLSEIFPTLAHEGYPGHLYQTVYYNQQEPATIRCALNFGGYSEGWATYVEMDSYHMAGLEENMATLLEKNNLASLCMYAKADIGVNYYNWDLKKTAAFLSTLGIKDTKDVQIIYQTMIDEPCKYMKYALGYLEIIDLRDEAMNTLGDKFQLKKFHEFFLQMGPAPFHVIRNYMQIWIKQQKQ